MVSKKRSGRPGRRSRGGNATLALSKAQEDVMDAFARNGGTYWTGLTGDRARESSLLAMERTGIVRLVTRKPKWVLASSWQASKEEGEKLWILLPAWRERAEEIRNKRKAAASGATSAAIDVSSLRRHRSSNPRSA